MYDLIGVLEEVSHFVLQKLSLNTGAVPSMD